MFEEEGDDAAEGLDAPTLVDIQAPEIEFEPEFEIQIPEKKPFWKNASRANSLGLISFWKPDCSLMHNHYLKN